MPNVNLPDNSETELPLPKTPIIEMDANRIPTLVEILHLSCNVFEARERSYSREDEEYKLYKEELFKRFYKGPEFEPIRQMVFAQVLYWTRYSDDLYEIYPAIRIWEEHRLKQNVEKLREQHDHNTL